MNAVGQPITPALTRRATFKTIAPILIWVGLGWIGVGVLFFCTRWGIGASPDSAVYLGAAQTLLAGRGLSVPFGNPVNSPLTQYPPLYPALLAAVGALGLGVGEAARWLQAGLFGANILLVAGLTQQVRGRGVWLPMLSALLWLISPAMLAIQVMAWSEPLFICLGFSGLLLLARYFENPSPKFLLIAASLIGLACLTRYAGIAFVITSLLAIVLLKPGSLRARVLPSIGFGSVASLPLLGWIVRNQLLAQTATNRVLAFHPLGRPQLWQAVDTISTWFLIPTQSARLIKLGVILAILFSGVAGAAWQLRARRGLSLTALRREALQAPVLAQLLALFIGVYGLFLVGSISFVDANTPLDNRLLSPIYVAGLVLGVAFASTMLELSGRRAWLQIALALAVLLFAGLSIDYSANLMSASYQNGIGFNQRAWHSSPTLAQVRALAADTLIYSNSPEAIYIQTGRSALSVPRTLRLMDQQANANYATELAGLQGQLTQAGGVVVYFNAVRGSSLPSAEALGAALPTATRFETLDGVIYTINK